MSTFILDTDALTSAASSISSLASEVTSISSSVSGYDTSCEDGFNFAGAKGVIAGNIEACATKIRNTAKVIESVVSAHTELQNSLKFEDPNAKQNSDSTDSNGNQTYTDGTTGYTGEYYSDVGTSEPTKTEEDKTGVVKTTISKVGYAYADDGNLSEQSKEIMNDKEFGYDNNGYAMIGERYVITCDSSVANVGDVIRFTQADGSVVECVVGVTTVTEKYKNTVNFLVDKNATSIKAIDLSKTLIQDNKQIENIGKFSDIRQAEKVKDIQAIMEAASKENTVQV